MSFFIASIHTYTHTLSLFPHVCTVHFLLWIAHGTFFFFLVFVFSLSFCVEVGFTHVDAGHCHNMTFQYVIATALTVTM